MSLSARIAIIVALGNHLLLNTNLSNSFKRSSIFFCCSLVRGADGRTVTVDDISMDNIAGGIYLSIFFSIIV
jgi:hypothetical protein